MVTLELSPPFGRARYIIRRAEQTDMDTIDSIQINGEPVRLFEPSDLSADDIHNVVVTTPDGSFYVVSSTGRLEDMEGVVPAEDANSEFDIV